MNPLFPTISRRALLVLMGLLFLWPKFVVLAPSVSPYTLSVLICVFLSGALLIFGRKGDSQLLLLSKIAAGLFVLFFAARFYSDIASRTVGNSVYYDLRDFIWGGSLFFIAAMLARSSDTRDQIGKIVSWSAIIIAATALLEQFTQLTLPALIMKYVPISIDDQFRQMLIQDKSREGAFRSQAFFSHPIVLSQVSASIFPIALSLFIVGSRRFLCIFAMISCVLAIHFSGSRSGEIALIAGVICFAVFFVILSRSKFVLAASAFMLPFVILATPIFVAAMDELAVGRSMVEQRSTDMRELMWQNGELAIQSSPIIGHGGGNSASLAGIRARFGGTFTIDDYYLSLILDAGYLSLVIFFIFIFSVFIVTIVAGGPVQVRIFRAGLFSSVVSLLVSFKATSILEGMAFLYLYAGLIVASHIREGATRRIATLENEMPGPNM